MSKKVKRRKKRSKTTTDPTILSAEFNSFRCEPYDDFVKCNFDMRNSKKTCFALPRITARIEKLMGSNVIRLTDRKFMNEVRARMQQDYEMQLKKRIKQREFKETERERNLILEGKQSVVPNDQSNHPIFQVNKSANQKIQVRRAKLKTNREKNAERLANQFTKWEKEKQRYDQLEAEKREKRIQEEYDEKNLMALSARDDKDRGLNLLKIHDKGWKTGEDTLRNFLDKERSKMQERSLKEPTPFLSDPKDINNIIKARKLFREAEKKVRQDLVTKTAVTSTIGAAKKALLEAGTKLKQIRQMKPDDDLDIAASNSNISLVDKIEFDTDKSRQAKIDELEAKIERDEEKRLVMPDAKLKSLYFEDSQIAQLKSTDTIQNLYKLAKEIITGEVEPEQEAEVEAENEEEEEEHERTIDDNDLEEEETSRHEEEDETSKHEEEDADRTED